MLEPPLGKEPLVETAIITVHACMFQSQFQSRLTKYSVKNKRSMVVIHLDKLSIKMVKTSCLMREISFQEKKEHIYSLKYVKLSHLHASLRLPTLVLLSTIQA